MENHKVNLKAAARLRALRLARGYDDAEAFARAHGLPNTTYRSHENGSRNITLRAAKRYADLLGSTFYWILEGRDAPMNLNDSEIAIIDVIKDVMYLFAKHRLATAQEFSDVFSARIEHYEKKGLKNAVDVMNHLKKHAEEELKKQGL